MGAFFRIAVSTARECLRLPACIALIGSQIFILGILPGMPLFAFRDKARVIAENALAAVFFISIISGILFAHRRIRRDLVRGTILQIATKPISRSLYVYAKILGVMTASLTIIITSSLATLYIVRSGSGIELKITFLWWYFGAIIMTAAINAWRNFTQGKNFSEGFTLCLLILGILAYVLCETVPSLQAFPYPEQLMKLLVLATMATAVMTAASCFLAFYCPLTLNLTFSALLFITGTALNTVAPELTGGIIPDWQKFWLTGILSNNAHIPTSYLIWAGCYAGGIVLMAMSLSAFLFEKREIAVLSD